MPLFVSCPLTLAGQVGLSSIITPDHYDKTIYKDTVRKFTEAADALHSRIAEVERLKEVLRRIETGECVTDWADQPHEQIQHEARAALNPRTIE